MYDPHISESKLDELLRRMNQNANSKNFSNHPGHEIVEFPSSKHDIFNRWNVLTAEVGVARMRRWNRKTGLEKEDNK
jgi:hypothetical protein